MLEFVDAVVCCASLSESLLMNNQDIAELVKLLEAELNNGGFDQFFFNSSGDKTDEIIEALQVVGAVKTAEICKRAAAKFPGGMPPKDWAKRQDVLVDEVSPEADAFQDMDRDFYSSSENLSELVSVFLNQ